SRRRHTRCLSDWSSDVCSSDLVEAADKSGALITAEHAAEQGRTVLAVPGPVDAASSGGCNALLRQGVILCRGADDVLEELQGVRSEERRVGKEGRRRRVGGDVK